MYMCQANALVNVGDPHIIYRTKSTMKETYEQMAATHPRIRDRLSKEYSLHPMQVIIYALICIRSICHFSLKTVFIY